MGKNEIKKFIINYIEKDIDPNDLWTMSRRQIIDVVYNKFKREGYNEREIEFLLDEVIYDEGKHLIEDEVSFDIVYPKSKKEKVRKFWLGKALLSYKMSTLILTSYISLLIIIFLIDPKNILPTFYVPILLLIIYTVITYAYKAFENSFKIMNKSRKRFIISYISGILISLISLLALNFFSITSMIAKEIIAYTFGGGLGLGGLIFKFIKEDGKK